MKECPRTHCISLYVCFIYLFPSLPITHTELFYFLLSVFVINGPWKGELHRVAPTEACSRPLVVLWCWSRRGVGDLPDGGGVVRGDWVTVNKMVLFEVTAHCDRTAPVWVITESEASAAQVDPPLFPHVFFHQAVEQKDKEPLERVEDGEEVNQDHSAWPKWKKAHWPRQA